MNNFTFCTSRAVYLYEFLLITDFLKVKEYWTQTVKLERVDLRESTPKFSRECEQVF